MANCGHCAKHCCFEIELDGPRGVGMIVPDGCICEIGTNHADMFHHTCRLGDGNPKSPNHNCPYFEGLQDGEPIRVVLR